jgi:tetratricopeptide (TPR) repeat protein
VGLKGTSEQPANPRWKMSEQHEDNQEGAVELKMEGMTPGELHDLGWKVLEEGRELENGTRFAAALMKYQRALQVFEQVPLGTPERERNVRIVFMDIGDVFNRQGKYARALEYYERALSIKIETLGERHPSVADTRNNMANVFQEQGEYARALENFERVLSIQIETLGELHPMLRVRSTTWPLFSFTKENMRTRWKATNARFRFRLKLSESDTPMLHKR